MRSSELAALTKEQLVASLKTMVGDERRLMVTMLEYLAEVEARMLYAELGCGSMFDFCRRRLGLSEDQACRRIAVARLGRKFPQVFAAIREGRLHLSSADKLAALFTAANVEELIEKANGKSMDQIDILKATLAPKAHVPESMRKLPKPRAAAAAAAVAAVAAAAAAAPGVAQPALSHALGLSQSPAQPHLLAPAPTAPVAVIPVEQSLTLTPLSETGYRLTLTAGTELHDDLMTLRALLKRENPKGDFLPILRAAVAEYRKKVEAEKLGKTTRPRKSKGPADPADVSRATKREVHERDGSQCTFVGADGERCSARELLELDHRQPRAHGGKGDASNIRLLCRTHNQYAAEQLFGRDFIAAKIRARRAPPALQPGHAGPGLDVAGAPGPLERSARNRDAHSRPR